MLLILIPALLAVTGHRWHSVSGSPWPQGGLHPPEPTKPQQCYCC